MNKNIFKFAFVAITAGVLAVSCAKEKDNDSAIQAPVMVSISADPYFVGSSAQVKATLTQALDFPVTVSLAAGTTLSKDYTTRIDSELLFLGDIIIPAGETEGSATVSVNNSRLEKGKYEAEIVAVGAKGANMSSKNAANILLLQGVSTASLSFASNFDASGEATFTVSLDMYSEEDCTVTISQFNFDIAGYTNVPPMAYSFDKEIVIKAGETEATGKVNIDLDALYDTGRYVGGLEIKSISSEKPEKFEVSDKAYYAGVAYNFVAPKKNRDWVIVYLGTQVVRDTPREVFYVSGVGGYLDYMISDAEQEEVNSFIYPEIIVNENDYIASLRKAGYTIDQILSSDAEEGYTYVTANKRAPGTYKVWIVAVSDQGVCTGEYSTLEFTVEEEPEPTEAYSAWLGDWVVGSSAESDKPFVVTITPKVVNESYYIDGLEGINTVQQMLSATADFNEDGTISIYPQVLGTWTHSTYGPAVDVFAGQIVDGGKTYFVETGDAPVAYGVMGADGTATLTPGTWIDEETGTVYGIVGLKYYWIVSAGAGSYSNYNTPLPNSLIPVKPEPNPEAVNSKKVDGKIIFRNQPVEHKEMAGSLTNHIRLK